MRIISAFVANHIGVHDSMLFVSGGWPEWWNLPDLPALTTIYFGAVAQFERDELGRDVELEVVLTNVDGTCLVASLIVVRRVSSDFVADAPLLAHIVVPMRLRFEGVGAQVFELRAGEEVLASVPLGVRVGPVADA